MYHAFIVCLVLVAINGLPENDQVPRRKDARVAIVGAGMAGLSTAARLLEDGYTDFDIFEAQDKVGGRVMPVKYRDGYLQMGAQFINGERNPIYDIANKLEVIKELFPDTGHFDGASFYHGECPVSKDDIELFKEFVNPLDPKYRALAHQNDERTYNETLKSLYDRDYAEFLKKNHIETGFRRNVFDALTRVYSDYWEFEWASKWEDQSLRNLIDWDDLGEIGVSYATDKFGWKAILDYIHHKVPSRHIHLNHRVGKIDYSGSRTKIWLSNGTLIPKEYDFVVVTSALGHLKLYARQMFNPPLPRKKLEQIDKIGMGGSMKIFFEWEKPFWSTPDFVPLPVAGCLGRTEIDPIESELTTFQEIDWAPNILVAWIAGHGPPLMDNLDDAELSARVTRLIRDMYQNQSIPEPKNIIRMRWTHNDLFMGSYSYVSLAQAQARIRHADLSIPVKKNGQVRVQFAGEATHYRLFEAAIGAFLSGRREGERIINSIATELSPVQNATIC